jgi:hypothetical protein
MHLYDMSTQIRCIFELARSMPTIMSAEQELELLQRLIACDERSLINEPGLLLEILSIIDESHSGGAFFEVNDNNYPSFVAGAD